MEHREVPPPYFGDYPHGAYWSAIERVGTQTSDEDKDYTVEGAELRVMWDEGAGPLWAEEGLFPDDPKWLHRALGLRDPLVVDHLTWLRDMTSPHIGSRVVDWRERGQQLDDRGR
jgi:hypothetical protein